MTQPHRVTLNEADFRALVAGRVVRKEDPGPLEPLSSFPTKPNAVEIILADIGLPAMVRALRDAFDVPLNWY